MRRLIFLLTLVSLLVTALGSALTPPVARAQEQEPPRCDMKRGPDGVTRGALMYLRTVIDDALDDEKESVDLDSDWLCHVPYAAQPYLRMTAENMLFFVYRVLPVSVFDATH